jgi:D-alanyl-D-alanine carboxypeptidase
MLEKKGYDGLKTGITDTAGPCLTASYRVIRNNKPVHIISVLINCKSQDSRWAETKAIISWILKSFFPKKV